MSQRRGEFDAHAEIVSVRPATAVSVHITRASPPASVASSAGVVVPLVTVNRTRPPWTTCDAVSPTETVSEMTSVGEADASSEFENSRTMYSSYGGPVLSPLHAAASVTSASAPRANLLMLPPNAKDDWILRTAPKQVKPLDGPTR